MKANAMDTYEPTRKPDNDNRIAALVPAAPERKRILRELLNAPEPWPATQRNLYRQMIGAEYSFLMHSMVDDVVAENLEISMFGALVIEGRVSEALAREIAKEAARNPPKEQTTGQRERQRRRTFREAVTAGDGARAVTTGLVKSCIACNGPLHKSHRHRRDSAYCSDACRQAAYRRRTAGVQP